MTRPMKAFEAGAFVLNYLTLGACERSRVVPKAFTALKTNFCLCLAIKSEMLWASVLSVDRKDSRAIVMAVYSHSPIMLPRPRPWTRETLEEESEDDSEPGRNLAFEVADASRAAERKSFRRGSSGLVRNKVFQVCSGFWGRSLNISLGGESVPRKQQRPERTLVLFWDGKAEVGITLRRRSCCCSGFRRMQCTRRSQFVSQLFQTTPLGCSLPCVGLRAEGGCAGLGGRRCREMAAGHGLGTGRVRAGHGLGTGWARAGHEHDTGRAGHGRAWVPRVPPPAASAALEKELGIQTAKVTVERLALGLWHRNEPLM